METVINLDEHSVVPEPVSGQLSDIKQWKPKQELLLSSIVQFKVASEVHVIPSFWHLLKQMKHNCDSSDKILVHVNCNLTKTNVDLLSEINVW